MSRKLNYIPNIQSYEDIAQEMEYDLSYRLQYRVHKTSLGRPLYERINVQIVMTQECPYSCPFCIERKHPMDGDNNFDEQLKSLKGVLDEHPNARLTITGGEPSLYIEQVSKINDVYKKYSNNTFISVNTTLYDDSILSLDIPTFNVSINEFVDKKTDLFDDRCCYQTILGDNKMNLSNIKTIMNSTPNNVHSFSFRFLTEIGKNNYSVGVWNELQKDNSVKVKTFRIGDFFVYATFDYNGKHARVTLGDMDRQTKIDYKDGYSNIIIHPDGRVGINWR